MKIEILQETLKRGLSTVGRAVAGKSTLPVLSNVLLRADDGRLHLSATNLEIGITTSAAAIVHEAGAVTLPAKLFSDVVGSLPNDKLALELDSRTQSVKITSGKTASTIKGIEADEFPVIPSVQARPLVTFAADNLREAINQVALAAATDDTRPVLAGVLFSIGDITTLAAADNFRLATKQIASELSGDAGNVVIPARAVQELARILGDDTVEMCLAPGGGQVVFRCGGVELVSRLIEGRFPDYNRIIPSSYNTRTVVEVPAFQKAIRLAWLFAASSNSTVKLEIGRNGIVISANAAEVGDNRTEVDALVEGPAMEIALNVTYLAAAVDAVKTAQVAIETQASSSPAVFKPVGADGYIHVVMPMAIR